MSLLVALADLVDPQDRERLLALAPLDALVGVVTLNHARSVVAVLESLAAGVVAAGPERKIALVVADDGSQDRTFDEVRAWQERAGPAAAAVRVRGLPGRGRAALALLALSCEAEARAMMLVEADLIGASPAWVEALLSPILRDEAAYVSPAYTRAITEGTLTSNLLAPLGRAIYGRRLQQFLGGCAALSGPLAGRVLASRVATALRSPEAVGLDLAIEAALSSLPVAEAHLGRKQTDPGGAPPDLATTLSRVVGPFLALMDDHAAAWLDVRGSTAVPLAGGPAELSPAGPDTHPERLVRAFRLGLKDLLPVWEQIMPEETLQRLYPLGLLPPDEFRFPAPEWARVVSDFAVAHHERRVPRDHLTRALVPLYLGRVAAFLLEARDRPPAHLSGLLDALGEAFEDERDRLASRWR